MPKDYLTYQDVAALWGLGRTTVYDIAQRFPDFPVVQLSSQTHIIPAEALRAWVLRHAGNGSFADLVSPHEKRPARTGRLTLKVRNNSVAHPNGFR